jgi:hypothetical protein
MVAETVFTMTERAQFDPSKYLTRVGKGDRAADYLEVKWRLVWLRDVAPDATLDTEHIRLDDIAAIFKATVQLPSGGRATGYGNCSAEEFPDYIGKAESVAIGRALAALGFGTQFAADFVEGGKPAESQVRRSGNVTPIDRNTGLLAGKALHDLLKAASANGWGRPAVETEARRRFGEADLTNLTIAQGDELVTWATAPRQAAAGKR